MSEVGHTTGGEDTLLPVEVEARRSKTAKDSAKIIDVLLERRAGNKDIIEVDENAFEAAEDTIHQPLERLGRILEAKRHAKEFVEAERRDDGRLLYVLL